LAPVRDSSQVFVSRFRCDSEGTARGLANALLVAGLYPELREPPFPRQPWDVAVLAQLEPTEDNVADLRETMAEAARHAGASFEGCERER